MALDLTGLKRPERSIANCTVTDVSSGAFPRDVTVKIPGVDGEVILAKWYGQTPLAVNDLVRIWVDGESQVARLAGESFSSTQSTASVDSAKVSTVYSPDLTIAALTADNNGDITLATGDLFLTAGAATIGTLLTTANLLSLGDRHNIQQLVSATPGTTHDFLYTELGLGLSGVENFGALWIAVAHRLTTDTTTDVAISVGVYLKPRGAGASVSEIVNLKAAGVTTFTPSLVTNTLRFTTDSDLQLALTTLALGGNV